MGRADCVAIVGVGLIGGSIGLALHARRSDTRVVGIGRDPARLAAARSIGAIDRATTRLDEGVAQADVVVVCTPVDRIAGDLRAAAAHVPVGALLTDAGSTKRGIVAEVEAASEACARFVGAHPIAGSEKKGAAHARADLFEGRVCVLTPTAATPPERLERARAFWSGLGCRLVEMDPEAHDRALAYTSHLPHAVAAALAAVVPVESLGLAAGAYRDVTRVAASDAELWTSIFLANREGVLDAVDAYAGELAAFRQALAERDTARLRSWWSVARARRLQYDPLTDEPST